MRISDWSSDVCSSDLTVAVSGHDAPTLPPHPRMMSDLGTSVGDGGSDQPARPNVISTLVPPPSRAQSPKRPPPASELGRAPCRARVWPYVSLSVVAGHLKKTILQKPTPHEALR